MLSPCFFCFFPFLLVFFSEFLGKVCAYGFAIQLRAGRFYRVVEKNVSHFFLLPATCNEERVLFIAFSCVRAEMSNQLTGQSQKCVILRVRFPH